MKFEELKIGDWFYDKYDKVFNPACIFIKAGETSAYALNWNVSSTSPMTDNIDVEFCPRFFASITDCTRGGLPYDRHPFKRMDEDKIHLTDNYQTIPIGALFRCSNGDCFKKLKDSDNDLCFWSMNDDKMGRPYPKEDIKSNIGQFCIYNYMGFEYVELANDSPYIARS